MNEDRVVKELEEKISNWEDSYETKSSYTQGKIVGAQHALNMLKDVVYEDE